MLKKSNRISLEEATRLAILGKLPLKENKSIKKESTTVTTTPDGLTAVETDDANIVIEPKENAAVDIGMGTEPVIDETPVEDIPVEEPVMDDSVEDEPEMEDFEESKKITEGEAPLFKKKINKTDIKKVENKGLKEHKVAFKQSNKLQEGVYTVEYIGSFDELYSSSWSGAISTLDTIREADKEDELMDYLESFGDSADTAMDRTELNDMLWFESDTIFADLGISDEEDLDESKKVEGCGKNCGKEKKEEGEAQLFKKKINKTDIKKIENKSKKEEAEKEPKRKVINKVDLRKTESKNLNKELKTKVEEGLSKFVNETYKNGKSVKVEKVLALTESKLYVKGKLVMESDTKDFTCKLIPIKENKTFRKYTIKENKQLKITEGKTLKGKEFSLILKK